MKILLVAALADELPVDELRRKGIRVVTTRVGKACAAYGLAKAIAEQRPDVVVNIGSAGTARWGVGDIIASRHFVDRDLAPLAIEGVVSEYAFPEGALQLPSLIGGEEKLGDFIVNTGDDFVTAGERIVGDVIDMEAFAEAVVCQGERVPLVAVKYITDRVGQNSVKQWNDKLRDARTALAEYIDRYIAPHIG